MRLPGGLLVIEDEDASVGDGRSGEAGAHRGAPLDDEPVFGEALDDTGLVPHGGPVDAAPLRPVFGVEHGRQAADDGAGERRDHPAGRKTVRHQRLQIVPGRQADNSTHTPSCPGSLETQVPHDERTLLSRREDGVGDEGGTRGVEKRSRRRHRSRDRLTRARNRLAARPGRLRAVPTPCGRSAVATHIDYCDPSSRVVPVAIPASVGHGIGRVDSSPPDLHHREACCAPGGATATATDVRMFVLERGCAVVGECPPGRSRREPPGVKVVAPGCGGFAPRAVGDDQTRARGSNPGEGAPRASKDEGR